MVDRIQFIIGPATGESGSASATGCTLPLQAEVLAVHVAYGGDPPATADLTLTDEDDRSGEPIVSLSNSASTVKLYPRRPTTTPDGTPLTYNGSEPVCVPYVVHGRLKGTLTHVNPGDYAIITVWYRR